MTGDVNAAVRGIGFIRDFHQQDATDNQPRAIRGDGNDLHKLEGHADRAFGHKRRGDAGMVHLSQACGVELGNTGGIAGGALVGRADCR